MLSTILGFVRWFPWTRGGVALETKIKGLQIGPANYFRVIGRNANVDLFKRTEFTAGGCQRGESPTE